MEFSLPRIVCLVILYEQDSLAMQIAPDWEIGVGINIPILDSSGRAGKTKAAHSAVMQVNYLRAQAVSDLSVLVEKTYKEAIQALEELESTFSRLAGHIEHIAEHRVVPDIVVPLHQAIGI